MYTVITENDESIWSDRTGELYHFPKRYLKFLNVGARVIYYKGKLKKKGFRELRLSDDPHYFGIAEIGKVFKDQESKKHDYYAEIINYMPFKPPVIAKEGGFYIERIPSNKRTNYWRDAVRPLEKDIYNLIISKATLSEPVLIEHNDINQGLDRSFESEKTEGAKKSRFTSYYERNPQLRLRALAVHGYTCMACNFNFEREYGELGKGFIHVHHVKPISESGETKVNPETDMIVLCTNCHAIVHRKRNNTLMLEELVDIINQNRH